MSRNSPGSMPTWESLTRFSQITLQLHLLAKEKNLDAFHQAALDCIRNLIPFRKAWWGRSALVEGIPREHSSYLHGLPQSWLTDWASIGHQDTTIRLVHEHQGQAVRVVMNGEQSSAGLRWLGHKHAIGELLCVVHSAPITQLRDHLSLYRHPDDPAFSKQDQQLLGNLMPHLACAVSSNQIRALVSMRESLSNTQDLALAVCDQRGTLYCAEQGFVDQLLEEWPGWQGPQLPGQVDPCGYESAKLKLDGQRHGDLYLLTARRRQLIEQLSGREGDVARRFGEGQTYKQIAQDLGVAPNTVRHHIRSIYSKLGINDKASIAQLLHKSSPG